MQIKRLEATNATSVRKIFQSCIILEGTSATTMERTGVKSVSFVPASSETILTIKDTKTKCTREERSTYAKCVTILSQQDINC